MGEAVGVTLWWPMEANSGVMGHVRARHKAPEGMTDRQTDTIHPLYAVLELFKNS